MSVAIVRKKIIKMGDKRNLPMEIIYETVVGKDVEIPFVIIYS